MMVLISLLMGFSEIMMGSRLAGKYSTIAASKKQPATCRLYGRRSNSSESHTLQ